MPKYLCVRVSFLDPVPTYHGSGDQGEPEWPPSPLRLYQALLDASASLWRGEQFEVRTADPRVARGVPAASSRGTGMPCWFTVSDRRTQ